MSKYLVLLMVALLIGLPTYAQSNLDSLKVKLDQVKGEEKVNTLNELYIYYNRLDPQVALQYALDALKLARTTGYKRGVSVSSNNIGVVYKNQGVYDKALDYYIEALRICDELDDKKLLASIMNNIGTVYSLKEIFDKGLIYYIESYELFKELGDSTQIIGALNNIGNAYFDMKKEDKALSYYTQALEMVDHRGGVPTFDPLNSIGNIHFFKQEYDWALQFYERSLQLEEDAGNPRGQAYALRNIGSVYLEQRDYDQAKLYFQRAHEIAVNLRANPILKDIYLGLSEIYFNQNKFREAFEVRVRYDEVKDNVYNEESSRKLAQLELAYEFQQQEKELEILQRRQEINDLQLANSRIVILLGIMGTILLIAAGFIIVKLKTSKRI